MFKFTLDHGEIKVEIKIAQSSQVAITVKDTGQGIPADQIPHIFDHFYQADDSSPREFEGTGIGMALAKELIELYNGAISVQCEQGRGSVFTILLPCDDSQNKVESATELPQPRLQSDHGLSDGAKTDPTDELAAANQSGSDKQEKILIVEDNRDVPAYIREQLAGDCRVIETHNGEEGISKVKEFIPDLNITDIMMPKMDGYQFILHMRLSQLNRKLRALIDQPAGQLIRSLRLQHAADLQAQNAGNNA